MQYDGFARVGVVTKTFFYSQSPRSASGLASGDSAGGRCLPGCAFVVGDKTENGKNLSIDNKPFRTIAKTVA